MNLSSEILILHNVIDLLFLINLTFITDNEEFTYDTTTYVFKLLDSHWPGRKFLRNYLLIQKDLASTLKNKDETENNHDEENQEIDDEEDTEPESESDDEDQIIYEYTKKFKKYKLCEMIISREFVLNNDYE